MARYRNNLPQLSNKFFLTDGGLETILIYHHGIDLPEFASCDLLRHAEGRQILTAYYEGFASIARANGVGFVFESASWRANADWLRKIGCSASAVEDLSRASIELILPLRDKYHSDDTPMVISGQVGPRGDGYKIDSAMTADEAQAYHARQIRALADTEADLVSALTLNYSAEAIGIARAATEENIPSVISFTLETNGCLPTGQSLGDAINEVDEATGSAPAYYMINCAHTTHFSDALDNAPWIKRVRAIRANASRLSHAELDECTLLDDGDPEEFGLEHATLRERFPHITVLGGCCGTDTRHVAALVQNRVRAAA
jgi:S-methylmethionine-dependent homocysteine/selenocysteine methylase